MILIPSVSNVTSVQKPEKPLHLRNVIDGRRTNELLSRSKLSVLAEKVVESDGTVPIADRLGFRFSCRFPAADRPWTRRKSCLQGAAVKKTQEVCSDASPWDAVQQRIGSPPGPAEQSQSRPGAAKPAIFSDIAIMQDAQGLFDKAWSPDLFGQVDDVQD